MADAIVGLVLENLNSLIVKEFGLHFGVGEDMRKLAETLSTIRDVLADAERRHITEKPIANWLTKLKHAAYDADDVLEEWLAKAQVSSSGSSFISSMNFRRKMAKKTKAILSKFDELAKQKNHFILSIGPFPEMHSQFDENRETTSLISEPQIYGRDGDKDYITHMLLLNNESNDKNVTVFPIVGMGGLGKTTLAQSVYNDERVERFFKPRIWVCVSEPFDIKRVLKDIIESFYLKSCDLETLESIQRQVKEILRDNKYLLVLDDVWNENQDEWNKLKSFLDCGAQGSSIILTTRSLEVALVTGIAQPYILEGLSDNDCWLLIKNYAFGNGHEEEHHPNLVPIGKAIAKRCKGLPLVAKTLGGLLGLKTEEDHWKHVKDNEIWNLKGEGEENSILLALRLSYDHLPSCLKQCFAFCSVYPKDYKMERGKLINLWVANGLIQSQESKELEEIGNSVFGELLQRSFFQDAKEDRRQNIVTCKMHDLMHDLAISIALNECLVIEVGESKKRVPKTIRHLGVTSNPPQSSALAEPLFTPQLSLRTLVFFNSINFDSFKFSSTLRALDLSYMKIRTLPPSICHLELLRCLDLSENYIKSLPDSIHRLKNLRSLDLKGNRQFRELPPSIGKLLNLRYLNLSDCQPLKSLPETVSDLTNLQSLLLLWCHKLVGLPETIRKMTSLKHLGIDGCNELTKMRGIGRLTSLRTLRGEFFVGNPDKHGEFAAGINELQGLNQLRGELKILGLENVSNAEDAKAANLGSKRYLTELKLLWQRGDGSFKANNSKEVVEGLLLHPHPPPNLQVLEIDNYGAEEFPPQIFQGGCVVPNALRSLMIGYCGNLKSLPPGIGYLTALTHLRIVHCPALKCLPVGIGDLTALTHLRIVHCPVKCLPVEIGDLTALTSLHISDCWELVSFPREMQKLTSLTSLEMWKCNSIKCLPMIGGGTEKNLSSLLKLRIMNFENLTYVEGLRYLTSLQHLEIQSCPKLDFRTEDGDDFQYLISLETLEMRCLPKLTALPEGIQHLPMLKRLVSSSCENLTTLPEGLKRLTTLDTLDIYNCHPDLTARCKTENSEDWHKISHISNLRISP